MRCYQIGNDYMKALYVNRHVKNIADIKLEWVDMPMPEIDESTCLIKVASSGVNPSDALAVLGYFEHAMLPRIPGRDFAGTVIKGPSHLRGKAVWGTGGAAGISFDGCQAEYIKLPLHSVAEVPHGLELLLAGAQPLPYVTAYYSLEKRAKIAAGETVLVVGALGQVGRAAMSICAWKQCQTIALVRGDSDVKQAEAYGWNVVNSDADDLAAKIKQANGGKPVNVILNSVGNIYWSDYMSVLSELGRIVTIGAKENTREASVNLFELYRANQDIIGVNTVSLNFQQNAVLLNELKIGFEEKKLTPLPLNPSHQFSPENAGQAYQTVMQSNAGQRVVIAFS
jgi:NADPH2:quinone reductase